MGVLMGDNHVLACTFGILGNIVSFLVYLAPISTFYRICKKKSTEGFQSIPYSVALFSAMLYLYYAFLKKNVIILITINITGCVFELTYLAIFMIYATKESKIFTTKLLLLFNTMVLGLIIACTYIFSEGHRRVVIVGWICATFSVGVFAAPLSIMRQVIRTKSVEFMPLSLSFFLTLCAVMWFFYGLLIKDYYIATPNILGFTLGITQMILYKVYKNPKPQILPQEPKIQDLNVAMEFEELHQHRRNSKTEPNIEELEKPQILPQEPKIQDLNVATEFEELDQHRQNSKTEPNIEELEKPQILPQEPKIQDLNVSMEFKELDQHRQNSKTEPNIEELEIVVVWLH